MAGENLSPDQLRQRSSTLKIELTTKPEQVVAVAEFSGVLVNQNRRGKRRVLPIKNEFGVPIQVPVHAQVCHRDFVGPFRFIRQSPIKDFVSHFEVAVPDERLNGPKLPAPATRIERPQWFDRLAAGYGLTGQKGCERDMKTVGLNINHFVV